MGKKINTENLKKFNPCDTFISNSEQVKEITKEEVVEANKETNFVITKEEKKEAKSKRLNLLIKPSTHLALKEKAEKYEISINDLINQLLEKGVEEI